MSLKQLAVVTFICDESGNVEAVVTGHPAGCAVEKMAEAYTRAWKAMADQKAEQTPTKGRPQ